MKKISFILIILGSLIKSVSAQKVIEFDFKEKTSPATCEVESIKKGEYYQIKINNINLNLFKVTINTADTIVSKALQTPTFGNFELDALSKVITGISPLSTLVQPNLMIEFDDTQMKFKEKADFSPAEFTQNQTIIEQMDKENTFLDNTKKGIEKNAIEIDALKLNVYKTKLNSYRLENPGANFDVIKALSEIENIRKSLTDLKTQTSSSKTTYLSFSEANKEPISKNPDLTANDKTIKESYDKLLTILSDAISSVSADKINELLSLIVFLENNKTNSYVSMPMQFMGDQTKVKLSIVPRDEKFNLQSYQSIIYFPEEIKKYTAIGISFYGSSLYDNAYSTIKTKVNDSTFNYSFKEENVGKAELGIAALLRYGTKFKNYDVVGGHVSLGAGVSISNKVKPRVLLGVGLTFGKKHMFALDAGGIAGYVDRLSNSIDLSMTYSEKPENITVSKLGIGGFLSMGYIYKF